MLTPYSSLELALAHARIARAARVRIAAARAANDATELDRWTKHERANMACFRRELNEAKVAR
jgi:hypothetical protein